MIDIETIRRDNPIPNIAAGLVKLKSAGSEWVACCPFHAERTPSFTIFADGLRFYCFGCGASGDVLDFMQRAYSVDLPEAARMLGAGEAPAMALPTLPPAERENRTVEALTIWDQAVPAAGTLAENYLWFRGISPPFPTDIRFSYLPCDNLGELPCLVAAVRNVAGDVTGIQRIWLAADGKGKADVAKPKRSLGRVKGGAIRLGEQGDSCTLTICEGPEDGLSLLYMLGGPVWVAAGASMLPGMEFPVGIKAIVIGADNDPAGERSAEVAARTFAARGLSVRIIRPLTGFKDFNDELRGAQ
ncbi:toprim domain-containing protein [Erythrobacteraceae bacterium E2-1 Yellow Sea]|nr:toprim domain-containing protein [Erythrobacteraceae bacterium E2-1 Yellow Sea]